MNEAVTAIPRNNPAERVPYPTLKDATRTWVRVALLSFGGPAGQIAVMHRILVEEKRWVSEQRFLHTAGRHLHYGAELRLCALGTGASCHGLTVRAQGSRTGNRH